MAKRFTACGAWLDDEHIRLWIGDTEGAESEPLTDEQIDALIRNLTAMKSMRGQGNITWVVPSAVPVGEQVITTTTSDPTTAVWRFGSAPCGERDSQ